MNQTKVVVTGGAGFIGSELTRQLVESGRRVLVVDNLVNGRAENLEGVLGPSCELVVLDIRDGARMEDQIAGAAIVFHLACLGVRHSIHSPRENHEVNATATLGLLSAARSRDVARFVYVSSSEVYGTARWAPMDEQHPTHPSTVYGASKLAGECYTRAFHRSYGYPTVVVRPFNAFGPRCHHEGDSGEVIPRFVLRCLAGQPMVVFGSGEQTRDFTYVSDTARGILLAGLTDAAVGETVNLGSGREVAIRQLAEEVATATGALPAQVVHQPERPGDVTRLCAGTARSQELLGFQAQVRLREGLDRLVTWYRTLGVTPQALLEQERVRNWE